MNYAPYLRGAERFSGLAQLGEAAFVVEQRVGFVPQGHLVNGTNIDGVVPVDVGINHPTAEESHGTFDDRQADLAHAVLKGRA